MPGRQSHGGPPSKKPKARVKSKKRSLDAFSIASKIDPENVKVKGHRLGTIEEDRRPTKRRKPDDESREEEELQTGRQNQSKHSQNGSDGLEVEGGSDSEGNEWKLGQVDDEDDSDIDSDEAFGESDEEIYEGFAFSGSTSKPKSSSAPRSRGRTSDVDLDEDEQLDNDSESEADGEDLGGEAMDLAAVLDAAEEDEAEDGKFDKVEDDNGSGSDSGFDSEESSDESLVSSTDDEDASDPTKAAALQNLIANLSQPEQQDRGPAKQRNDGANELSTPSDFGLKPRSKLTLEDLSLPGIKDPHIRNSLRLLGSEVNGKSNRKVPKKLEVPLPRRQQDCLDRAAAYEKTKETFSRWTDTVKHNRRADHLIFPLPDPVLESAHANNRLQPTAYSKPFNELEATIQSILEESGLATVNGKDDEDHIREFEELATNKMSMEEVRARRDQLRMVRELLFREEAKAKRIKKIKSKSYRKVHRKQREKENRQNREALLEGGFVPSEDEMEAQDRRRAEERMGQRHRGSKWAKAAKATGRGAWDEEARSGITELVRRDEELRKRVEGKISREEGQDDSDDSLGDSKSEVSDDDELSEQKHLLRQVDKIENADGTFDSGPGSNLVNMPFMQKAEEARKKANDAMLTSIRRDIAGEESSSEAEDLDIGRRKYGPVNRREQEATRQAQHLNEFEEPLPSDGEEAIDGPSIDPQHVNENLPKTAPKSALKDVKYTKIEPPQFQSSGGGAWSRTRPRGDIISQSQAKRSKQTDNNLAEVEELDLSQAVVIAQPPSIKNKSKTTTLEVPSDDDSGGENNGRLPFAIRDQELIKRAFAGADVVGDFEAEKKQTVEDEEEKVIDNTLPGWGSWVGEGVSKKEKQRHKGRFLAKTEGIKEQNRKDAKLERVIINEKRVKKVCIPSFSRCIMLTLCVECQISCIEPPSSFRDRTAIRTVFAIACGTGMGYEGDFPGSYQAESPT